jgi:hypothetical protein
MMKTAASTVKIKFAMKVNGVVGVSAKNVIVTSGIRGDGEGTVV